MAMSYGLNLEEGEKIIWMGKRSIRSMWLPFIMGIITLPLYGLGVLFILYGISIWLRVDYVITSHRVLKIIRHYLSHPIRYDIEEIRRERVRSFYSLEKGIFGMRYFNLVVENNKKIVFKGIGDVEGVKKILSAGTNSPQKSFPSSNLL